MSRPYPIDFSALNKGDVITQQQIESIYAVKFDDSPEAFRLLQMQLRQDIIENRDDLVVKASGRGLEILHDLQGCEHTFNQTLQAERRIVNMAKLRGRIDRTGFDETQQRVADFRDRHTTGMAIVAKKAIKDARNEQLFLSGGKSPEELSEKKENE